MVVRKWAGVVLIGLLAGCGWANGGGGTPDAAPSGSPGSSVPGLPVPSDPLEPTTTEPTAEPTTAAPTTAAPTSAATTPAPTAATTTTRAARPCPADVAATLPGGGPATLVAGYGTAHFRLYICRAAGGLYYRGISRADPRQATTIPATTVPGGYQARKVFQGSLYVYRVADRRLMVSKDGVLLLSEPVTSTL